MGVEIERKFLVVGRPWEGVRGDEIVQAYVADEGGRVVRVRARGDRGYLTIKGPARGLTRPEYEVPIPAEMVHDMIGALGLTGVIRKARHEVDVAGHTWEIDVFAGENEGLVVAEIELDSEDESFELPSWAGREVSDDLRYTNAALARRPWCGWGR